MDRFIYIALVLALATYFPSQIQGKTMIVATQSSSEKSKATADFVGDGVGDQEEMYAAIHALPPSGGTVTLMEGTYDIRKVEGKLDRSCARGGRSGYCFSVLGRFRTACDFQ